MKLLIVSLVILVVVAHVHAFLPLLSLKVDSLESDSSEESIFKLPKLDLFGKGLFNLKRKKSKKGKDTLLEKIIDKKVDKFEDKLLDFFDDKGKAKTIFEKLKAFKKPESEEVIPCACKERTYDDCDADHIRYFS